MAAFGTGGSRSVSRGPSPGFRFTLYAILSFVVMFFDQRLGWMGHAHFMLQTAAYPVQLAVGSPSAAWDWMQQNFESREALRAENERLKARDRDLAMRSMRYEALARENGELRGLRDALPPVADHWLTAEVVVDVQVKSLRQRIVINRGKLNGVFKAQAVLDDKGVIGQTTHVGAWSTEVILITDPEHAIPVQVERTGLRTIAVGAGDSSGLLALPYLPGNADIKAGDVLMTSGLGGVFPAGYPVAKVTEVHRDAVQPLAQVLAAPFASVDTDREVVLVWFREDNPAAPVSVASGDLKAGNPNLKPQPAPPPRPKAPSPQAPAPATPTSPPSSGTGAAVTSPAGTGARNSASGSGTVNPAAATPSKGGAPAAKPSGSRPAGSASDGTHADRATAVAPDAPKEPAAGDNTRAAAPPKPTPTDPSPDATPRNE